MCEFDCQLITSERAVQLWRFRRALDGDGSQACDWFLPDHPHRVALWNIIASTVHTTTTSRLTASQLVEALAPINAPLVGNNRDTNGRDEIEPILPNLNAEIRRLGEAPVAFGGFCDVWLGERLGRDKVALKVLKVYDVPEQVRKVRRCDWLYEAFLFLLTHLLDSGFCGRRRCGLN